MYSSINSQTKWFLNTINYSWACTFENFWNLILILIYLQRQSTLSTQRKYWWRPIYTISTGRSLSLCIYTYFLTHFSCSVLDIQNHKVYTITQMHGHHAMLTRLMRIPLLWDKEWIYIILTSFLLLVWWRSAVTAYSTRSLLGYCNGRKRTEASITTILMLIWGL